MMTLKFPDKCSGCGKDQEAMKEDHGGWVVFKLAPGLALCGCPYCHMTHFNANAMDNFKEFQALQQEAAERRIVIPAGVGIPPNGGR